MATTTTTHLGLTKVEANDTLPQASVNANFDTIDAYVAARALTNKSGGTVAANSVVVADTTTDSAFTTTATAGNAKVVGVTQASIANNASGIVKQYGVTQVLVTAATSRGDWLTTSTTAGQALPNTSTNPVAGSFAIALSTTTGAGTVTALLITAAVQNSVWSKGSDLTSQAALQLGSSGSGQYFHVTGTTTITSFSTRTAGEYLILEFDGALTLTHNATTLILIGAANYTTTAGDVFLFVSEGSGNWRQVSGPAAQLNPFDMLRSQMRSGRRMVGLYFGGNVHASVRETVGVGVGVDASAAYANTNVSGEPVTQVTMANANGFIGPAGVGIASLAPNKSPRMIVRTSVPASSANTSWWMAGFIDSASATANGAYLRCNTTDANLTFVTRQGGAETVQTVAARPSASTPITYEIESPDAGVTWNLRNGATGALLLTSTTNVPTAGTAIGWGIYHKNTGAAGTFNVAHLQVEASFTP